MGLIESRCYMTNIKSEKSRVKIMGLLTTAIKQINLEMEDTGIDYQTLGLRVEQYKTGGTTLIEIRMTV